MGKKQRFLSGGVSSKYQRLSVRVPDGEGIHAGEHLGDVSTFFPVDAGQYGAITCGYCLSLGISLEESLMVINLPVGDGDDAILDKRLLSGGSRVDNG